MHSNTKSTILPALALIYTATLWGVFWYPLRLLEGVGLQGMWSTFLIYGSTLPIALIFLKKNWQDLYRRPYTLVLIAIANGICNTAFILAVLEGEVVRVLLLFYLSPVWTVMLGMIVLKERLTRMSTLTLIVAMIGALVMLWDPAMGAPWPQSYGDWLAILSGFSFAVSNVAVRKTQDISIQIKTAMIWLGVIAVAGIGLMSEQLPLPDINIEVYGYVFLLGLFMVVGMTFAVQYGVTHMPVQRSAVILLFEIVVGAASSQLLTEEVIRPTEWLGGILIITAAYFAATRKNNS
ncbi:MAG: DMT family transporter [Gammaproteobacteria bacterium]|nr:DMT family transporter [Gammaproteobacteria bacterium]MDH5594107.1 DMT family transporter [Gammaproteobacteria bacterium]MDH5614421.1 DMT family transporter [Gammaproteobacteria bacterium]